MSGLLHHHLQHLGTRLTVATEPVLDVTQLDNYNHQPIYVCVCMCIGAQIENQMDH